MAHEITNNMMSWKGDTPWHGLGVQVPKDATGEDMLKLAKLDWQVHKRGLAMRNATGDKDRMLSQPLVNWKAIVRKDTDEVFCIATNKYQMVQNAEVIALFREYCEAGHATMETVGGLNGGRQIWALARLGKYADATIGGVDKVQGYVLLATSHDGSLRTIGKRTQVRVVCANTLSAALRAGKADFSLKHTAKWTEDRKQEAKELMGIAVEETHKMNELCEKLSQVTIDQTGRLEFLTQILQGKSVMDQVIDNTSKSLLDKAIDNHESKRLTEDNLNVLGKAILESMLNSPGSDLITAKDTLWGAVNGVSYYTDHLRGRTQDGRLNSAWFGDSNNLKLAAMQTAVQMAGIRA